MTFTTLITVEQLAALQASGAPLLLDCSFELSDPSAGQRACAAGHLPGAVNRLFRHNLAADGRFKPAEQLRAEFDALRGSRAPAALVSQCGSGVTACHNLLALEVAGLPGAVLYPGSWSEWCARPGAPLATGNA